jgi:AcrR family transcriptional regulator
LLHEATEILARDGFAALTVRRVAQAAQCSTIGIYTHFGDKHGLVEAVLLELYAAFEAALGSADTTPPGRAQLTASARAYRQWALTNRSGYVVMLGSFSGDFVASAAAGERMHRSFVAHTHRVSEAMRVGEVAGGDPAEIARHLWACVHGPVMLDLLMRVRADDEAAGATFDRAIDLMLDGVAPRPAARPRTRGR